jgi:protein TonB
VSNLSYIWSLLGHLGLFVGASFYSSLSLSGVEAVEINKVFGNGGQNFIEVSIGSLGSPVSQGEQEEVKEVPTKQVANQVPESINNQIKSTEVVPVKKNTHLRKVKKNLESVPKTNLSLDNNTVQSAQVDPSQQSAVGGVGLARLGSEGDNSNSQVTYRDMFFAKILGEKRYPEKARKRQIEGSGFLEISLDSGGKVVHLNLIKSTGSDLLDEEIFSLIKRAEPFPKLPNDLAEFKARLPIEFSLSNSR